MRILQICNKPPYPPVDGGTIAMNIVTKGLLAKNIDVKVLTVATAKHPFLPEALPEDYKNKTQIEGVYINTEVKLLDAFSNLFTDKSYNITRFISRKFANKLIEILTNEDFDIIQLESIFVAPYLDVIKKYSNATAVLRAHNIEHLIWQRRTDIQGNLLKKAYFQFLTNRLQGYEKSIMDLFDGIMAISEIDKQSFIEFGCKQPIISIPVGIDIPVIENNIKQKINSIYYLGSMDWLPNVEGLHWFLKYAWPIVLAQLPDMMFYIAGRKSEKLKNIKAPNTKIVGEVDNAQDFMLAHDIMIVPLLSGSGIRVKIIEGMALGKTIVTSTIGAEGIAYKKDFHLLIGNSPEDFAKSIIKTAKSPELYNQVGINARRAAIENYSNTILTEKIINFYHSLLSKKQ